MPNKNLHLDKKLVNLRQALESDIDVMYQWRNEPLIVELSTSRKKVTWQEHHEWVLNSLKDINKIIYIIQFKDIPIGQIRYDKNENDEIVLSVYLSEDYASKGLGPEAIRQGNALIRKCWSVPSIIARVRVENKRAIKNFTKIGFKEFKRETIDNLQHICFVFSFKNKIDG